MPENGGELVFELRRDPALEREDEKGVRQEGVAAKAHGHDSARLIFHEVGKYRVGYAETQVVSVSAKLDPPFPLRGC